MLQSILDSLAIDPQVLALNAVAFVVLLVIMDRVFWKPMLRHLERRNKRIADVYLTIENTQTQMEALRSEYQKRISAIEAEARSRIQQTMRVAQAARDATLAQARETAERLNREGLEQIEADRASARAAAEQRLERAALEALARAQGAPVDDAQRALIDSFIMGSEAET